MHSDTIPLATLVRTLLIIIALLTCALLESCGGIYFVGFVSNPGGATKVVGVVSAVTLGFVSDPTGVITPLTAVTLTDAGTAITIKFCGDQKQWFPINQRIRAEYIAGVFCNVLQDAVVDATGDSVSKSSQE